MTKKARVFYRAVYTPRIPLAQSGATHGGHVKPRGMAMIAPQENQGNAQKRKANREMAVAQARSFTRFLQQEVSVRKVVAKKTDRDRWCDFPFFSRPTQGQSRLAGGPTPRGSRGEVLCAVRRGACGVVRSGVAWCGAVVVSVELPECAQHLHAGCDDRCGGDS